jgi:methylenetetrahydrofolate dehydrogenase (NADP+) / methenyltetrahydrofolate cyclohydrolase
LETRVLEGREIARAIRSDVEGRVSALGRAVGLAIVMAGDDPASRVYSESIGRASARVGIKTDMIELPSSVREDDMRRTLRELGEDASVSGIIVQRPLPVGLPDDVLDEIAPAKDVDCATAYSLGLLLAGRERFAPCTALAVLELLDGHGVALAGAHVVIVGRSAVVGKPLAALLLAKSPNRNATVTVCHTATRDLAAQTLRGDIVVAAMGRARALRGDMVAVGSVIVDVGINSVADPDSDAGQRIVGDVAFEEMIGRAGAVTPVPGGVGALTTSILLRSVVEAAEGRG